MIYNIFETYLKCGNALCKAIQMSIVKSISLEGPDKGDNILI